MHVPMDAHPLVVLGFEPVALTAPGNPRSLTDFGFETVMHTIVRPQAVGAVEPASGRKIVQPTDNPAVNQALATEAMPAYKVRLLQAIRHIPGARLAASRDAKNPQRLAEKIARQGQPAETVSDYGAAQIAVASLQAKDAVVAAVKRLFPVLRQQDNFAFGDPEYHYRSYSLQLQMPNGSSEELQIVPEEVLEANRQEHHDYKQVAQRGARRQGCRAGASSREGHQRFRDGAVQRRESGERSGRERGQGKVSQRRAGESPLCRSQYAHCACTHRRRKEHNRAPQRPKELRADGSQTKDGCPTSRSFFARCGIPPRLTAKCVG